MTVKIRHQVCTSNVELLSMSLRPKYLPREFGQLFVTVVYVHPAANEARAIDTIADCIHELELVNPDAPNFILGDFNTCNITKALPNYHQYVSCFTRGNKTLDRCYGNIPDAYKAVQKAPVGNSDHNAVQLIPKYRQKVRRVKPVKRDVAVWSDASIAELQGCFECTDWDVFFGPDESIDFVTDVISDYIKFCKDLYIPTKTVKTFSNNKPWMTSALKQTINEKKRAFMLNNRTEGKRIQIQLRREIREAKRAYKEKIEQRFKQGNMRDAWRGLKTLAGQQPISQHADHTYEERRDFAENLNDFYCRFDKHDFSSNLNAVQSELGKNKSLYSFVFGEITTETVQTIFKRQEGHWT